MAERDGFMIQNEVNVIKEQNAVKTSASNSKDPSRNYQIDLLKFVFTIFVFLTHTGPFIGENTRVQLPPQIGRISVHFFFVVSGMLMTNSIMKSNKDISQPGKSAIQFVLRKFKGIALQYYVALFICLMADIFINVFINQKTLNDVLTRIFRAFPEMFLMTNSGVVIEYNAPTWYLSAMFIVMLPLAYLLFKHRDVFLNVLAPLIAVLSLGFWYQTNDFAFADNRNVLYGFVIGGVIRALCGLCFGVVAWQIYNKLCCMINRKSQKILITVFEIFLWFVFFFTWFVLKDPKAIVSVLFILPIAIAISFSRKSYVSKLFEFKWMKVLSPISLAFYLNHYITIYFVKLNFPDCSYKLALSLTAAFTLVLCLVYFLFIYLLRKLWNNKLKKVFSNQEEQ